MRNPKDFSTIISNWMKANDFNITQASATLGVSTSTVCNYLTGSWTPTKNQMERIAQVLGVKATTLAVAVMLTNSKHRS